jgi:thiamine monophosphate kinase
MARVISDFAAMAGTPCHALVTLIAPPQTPVKRVLAVYAGSGSDAIYRVSNILRFQSPDPNVYLKKN